MAKKRSEFSPCTLMFSSGDRVLEGGKARVPSGAAAVAVRPNPWRIGEVEKGNTVIGPYHDFIAPARTFESWTVSIQGSSSTPQEGQPGVAAPQARHNARVRECRARPGRRAGQCRPVNGRWNQSPRDPPAGGPGRYLPQPRYNGSSSRSAFAARGGRCRAAAWSAAQRSRGRQGSAPRP